MKDINAINMEKLSRTEVQQILEKFVDNFNQTVEAKWKLNDYIYTFLVFLKF